LDGLAAIREVRTDAAAQRHSHPWPLHRPLVMPGDRERCLAAGATVLSEQAGGFESAGEIGEAAAAEEGKEE